MITLDGARAAIGQPGTGPLTARVNVGFAGDFPMFTIITAGAAPVVSKDAYVNATYTITHPQARTERGGLRIRGRGNHTWGLPKKPYRLNFDKATAPLGMTAKQRNWALLASHDDHRKISSILGFELAYGMDGLTWTPEYRIVEVTLNGDYLGVYLLTDLVRIEAGRVDAATVDAVSGDGLTGTYLAEISRRYIDEGAPGFTTTRGVMIQYEDPEVGLASVVPEEVTQAAYFRDFIQTFEDALYSVNFTDPLLGYAQHIDMQSFVDWWLVAEFGSSQDSNFESSVKLWKARDSAGGRLHMGPIWDMSIAFGNAVNIGHPPQGWNTVFGAIWIHRALSDPAFKAMCLERWAHVRDNLIPALLATVENRMGEQSAAIARDEARWDEWSPIDVPTEAAFVTGWIQTRAAWMDTNLPLIVGAAPG